MANENIGEVDFKLEVKGFVRRDAKGKLYVFETRYGILSPRLALFQEIIKEHAKMYGEPQAGYDGGKAAPEPEKLPAIAQQTQARPEPEPVEIVEQGDDFNSWMEN